MTTAPQQVQDIVFSSTSDLKLQFVKFMIHSRPHQGKTEIIKTLPKPCVFAAEKGLMTLRKINIPFKQLKTIDEVINTTRWIRAGMYKGKFDSLVLDSVSYLSSMILLEQRSDPTKYTANGQKHYGFMKDTISDLLQAMFEADAHVYVTAWSLEDFDHMGNPSLRPYVEGKALQAYLIHYFDLTAHLAWHKIATTNADGSKGETMMPYLQTVEANGVFARCRLQGTLGAFEQPNLNDIINKLMQ